MDGAEIGIERVSSCWPLSWASEQTSGSESEALGRMAAVLVLVVVGCLLGGLAIAIG